MPPHRARARAPPSSITITGPFPPTGAPTPPAPIVPLRQPAGQRNRGSTLADGLDPRAAPEGALSLIPIADAVGGISGVRGQCVRPPERSELSVQRRSV